MGMLSFWTGEAPCVTVLQTLRGEGEREVSSRVGEREMSSLARMLKTSLAILLTDLLIVAMVSCMRRTSMTSVW